MSLPLNEKFVCRPVKTINCIQKVKLYATIRFVIINIILFQLGIDIKILITSLIDDKILGEVHYRHNKQYDKICPWPYVSYLRDYFLIFFFLSNTLVGSLTCYNITVIHRVYRHSSVSYNNKMFFVFL